MKLIIKSIGIAIALSLTLLMYPTESPNAKSSPVTKSGTVKEAKLRLDDLLDALTGEDSREDSGKDSERDSEKDSKEKTEKEKRRERQRNILEGIGSILASSGEIDYESERTIGESLALEGFHRYGMPVDNHPLQKYVNLVGHAVAHNSLRPGIPYRFVVVKSSLQNAFSCPGGIIFISSELLNTIKTEAQLACILAHEVAHARSPRQP
ncbi:MAG: M48 family metalloprotease [Deltaproteobacteria bacterium]|nr:M48 family metalloprotease [Deltaproteobacteria bacterium]